MDYNTYQNAWTPCQLGRVHANFSNRKATQRKLLDPRWCNPTDRTATLVADTAVWNAAKDLTGDLVVSGCLTVRCRVSIPKDGKIIVAAGGTLVLDGAWLENSCDLPWQGIEVAQQGKRKGQVIFEHLPTFTQMQQPLDFDIIYKTGAKTN